MTYQQEDSMKRSVIRRLIAKLEESPVTTTSNRHETLREYLIAIRGVVTPNDPFGQHMLGLIYRDGTVKATGIFRRVRELHDAVIAAGGTLDDARTWTGQALRWWRTGKAVDQKYARFEIDPRASHAMDDLLNFLQALPADLLKPVAIGLLLPRQFPFGAKPPDKPNTQPTQSPFGNRSPFAGNNPPTPPASPSSPFGSQPPTPPKPPSPFGNRPPFGQPAPDALPFHVSICFDALAVTPDSPAPAGGKPIDPLEWLESLAQRDSGTNQPEAEPEPLPTDFKGLLDRLHRALNAKNNVEFDRVLAALGKLNDMRALDHLYNLTRDTGADSNLLDVFVIMGGDVGIAGLISLLPLENDKREAWLNALLQVTRCAMTGDQPLSEVSLDALWKIAIAESAPTIEFCPAALHLLAATKQPEAQPVLWEHARSDDVQRVRTALAALTQLDPGDKLDDLLAAVGNAPDVPLRPVNFPFGAPAFNPDIAPVSIPFERLAAVVLGPKSKLRASALSLLSRIDDPRVVPFLIGQLTRRVREVALNQLRRLKATEAADAVAELMDKDAALRQRAAEILCEWDDPRCVPVLLPLIASEEPDKVIRRVGKLGHPDFDVWLLNKAETLEQDNNNTADEMLIKIIDALNDLASSSLRAVLDRLVHSRSLKVQLTVIRMLGKLDHEWAQAALRELIHDDNPPASYLAAALCKDGTGAQELLDSPSEVKRMIGVRLLWAAGDSAALIACLSDRSAAVRDTALWALANIQAADAADIFRRIVAREDRIDSWNINRAVITWRGLAKLNALAPSDTSDTVVPIAS